MFFEHIYSAITNVRLRLFSLPVTGAGRRGVRAAPRPVQAADVPDPDPGLDRPPPPHAGAGGALHPGARREVRRTAQPGVENR